MVVVCIPEPGHRYSRAIKGFSVSVCMCMYVWCVCECMCVVFVHACLYVCACVYACMCICLCMCVCVYRSGRLILGVFLSCFCPSFISVAVITKTTSGKRFLWLLTPGYSSSSLQSQGRNSVASLFHSQEHRGDKFMDAYCSTYFFTLKRFRI